MEKLITLILTLAFFTQVFSQVDELGQSDSTYAYLSDIYEKLNVIDSAVHYGQKDLDIKRNKQDYEGLSRGFNRMHALLRWSLGSASEETYMLKNLMDSCVFYARKSENAQLLAEMLLWHGMYLKNYDQKRALGAINEAMTITQVDTPCNYHHIQSYFQRGLVFYSYNKYKAAEADLKHGLALLAGCHQLKRYESDFLFHLGMIYRKTNQLDKALKYTYAAYQQTIEHDRNADLEGFYANLAILYRDLGKKDSCIIILSKHVNGLYQKFDKKSAAEIAKSGAYFQMEEKELRIDNLETINEQKEQLTRFQRNFILLLSVSLIVVFALVIMVSRQYVKTRLTLHKIEEKNQKIKEQEQEIRVLKEKKAIELAGRFEKDLLRLEKLMQQDKLFLDPDLTLSMLSQILHINKAYLSSIINEHFGCRFTDLVNTYRVQESIKLLETGWHQKYSMDALANKVGFLSKSSFYRAFKKITQKTPAAYLREINL